MCAKVNTPGVIITHGTDTMIETAGSVAQSLPPDDQKVVVFVGSSQPESLKDTDADFNIGFAFAATQCLSQAGVYITMNGRVFRYDECRKTEEGFFVEK
jgi:L-asparaginase